MSTILFFFVYFFYLGFFSNIPCERHSVVGDFFHVPNRAEALLVVSCIRGQRTMFQWVQWTLVSVSLSSNILGHFQNCIAVTKYRQWKTIALEDLYLT